MKLGTQKVRNSNASNILVNVVAVLLFILLIFILFVLNNRKVKTVGIVQVKEDVYVNTLITEDRIQEYKMSQIEYDNSANKYLLWENKDDCIEKYASVATKANGYIYEGDYTKDKPAKNAYFINLQPDDLIVTLPYDYSVFGNLITPGDELKVNGVYVKDGVGASDFKNIDDLNNVVESITLFEKLTIIDMLNASGNSVYDYYTDLLNMSLEERETTLRSDEFIQNVSPQSLVLSVKNTEEFNAYTRLKNIPGLTIEYGLYPRKDAEGGDIIGQFEDLTRQISAARTQADAEKAKNEGR